MKRLVKGYDRKYVEFVEKSQSTLTWFLHLYIIAAIINPDS